MCLGQRFGEGNGLRAAKSIERKELTLSGNKIVDVAGNCCENIAEFERDRSTLIYCRATNRPAPQRRSGGYVVAFSSVSLLILVVDPPKPKSRYPRLG